jgi:tRNA-dihydrouridine synthase C
MKPGFLTFAPLQGVADDAVRELMTSIGGMDACVAAFVRVSGHPATEAALLRECPELASDGCSRAGVPVHVQLLGGVAGPVAASAAIASALGARAIDLNFGCPVRRVNRHDGGAALLRSPARITALVRAVRDAVPPRVAVSAKLRLGWANKNEAAALARAAEDGGADWITVHGRTKLQGYGGRADWDGIGLARRAVRISVIANGDLRSPEDLAACRAVTGCEHFMVGRGAMARPELFLILRGQSGPWPGWRRLDVLRRYAAMLQAHGVTEGGTLGRVKGWCRYMAEADPDIASLFDALKRDHDLTVSLDRLAVAATPSFCGESSP